MASNKKKELIIQTFHLLKTSSPDQVSIRGIAAASGCTSATIYRHFDDLEHLVTLACVRCMEDFIIEATTLIQEVTDALEIRNQMWKLFATYAFKNVDIFEHLFWGPANSKLGDYIFEYYQLFPDKWINLNALFTTVFFNSNLEERNRIVTRQLASNGYIHFDEINLFSDTECYIFHGLLMEYKDKYRIPGKAQEGVDKFMSILDSLIAHYRTK